MVRRTDNHLEVANVMEGFQKSEESSSHRNGTFKIEKPFDEAIDTILPRRTKTNPSRKVIK